MSDVRTFAIRSAVRSPLNSGQWLLTLECGHEQWVTQKTRPRRRMQCRVAICALGTLKDTVTIDGGKR